MEPSRSLEASQNCFLRKGARHRASPVAGNEIYLYDEAEALMYVCSETSLPPRSAGNLRTPQNAENFDGGSPSRTSRKKSRKSSTLVYESKELLANKCQPPWSSEGATHQVVSDFKSQIQSKFKEFAIAPNSSCTNFNEPSNSVASGTIADLGNKNEVDSQDIEEIFIHDKFFTSSSESERLRVLSEDLQDDVYSTGMSDMEEGAITAQVKDKSEARAQQSREIIETTGLPPWYATKSIVKPMDPTTVKPVARESPTRIGPPVQGRLSLRTMKTTPPCFCLLDEIRKNNLVMKEDIFSSSSLKAGTQNVGSSSNTAGNSKDTLGKCRKSMDADGGRKQEQSTTNGATANANKIQVNKMTRTEEVYEASVGRQANARAQQKQAPHSRPATPTTNALAVNIRYVKNQFEKFWRPFSPPNQDDGSERSVQALKVTGKPFLMSQKKESVIQTEDPKPQRAENHMTSKGNVNTVSNNLEAKPATPNRWPDKYVKLPGLVEALDQTDSNFKGLRIKDGMSFESVNALKEMTVKTQMKTAQENKDEGTMTEPRLESKGAGTERQVTQMKTETKDAATGIRIQLMSTKTQTGNLDFVDISVQCDSHAIDEASGRNTIKRDHKEIMICNDYGEGVQLYNELGHPLTDMDGYLLKDSHGRFLVRLDEFGVPVSCTNGQAIFMEDSTLWGAVKTDMSIVHQTKKKPIKRSETAKKSGKARSSIHQLETAMKNLEDTLMRAGSLNNNDDIFKLFTNFDASESKQRRKNSPTRDASIINKNDTTSLIEEMKSIARLRNALLEKANFIAGGGKNLRKPCASTKLPRKKSLSGSHELYNGMPNNFVSIWEGQERPFSPTNQAIKKLKEEAEVRDEVKTGADPWMPTGLDHDESLGKPYGRSTGIGLDPWMGSEANGIDLGEQAASVRNQEMDSWTDAIPGNSLNTDFPVIRGPRGNKGNATDLWSFNDKPTDTLRATEVDGSANIGIPQTNSYRELDKYLEELSGMKLSRETDNPQSSISVKPTFARSQLLILLEKQYNVREGSSLIEGPTNSRTEGPSRYKQGRRRGERRPSAEFSSGSSNNL